MIHGMTDVPVTSAMEERVSFHFFRFTTKDERISAGTALSYRMQSTLEVPLVSSRLECVRCLLQRALLCSWHPSRAPLLV